MPSRPEHDDANQDDSFQLLAMDEIGEEPLYLPPPRSVLYMLVLCSGFGTLQLVFALLASYGSAQLLSVGVSQAATGLTWLAGPLAGTFVQPLVGIMSDKFGHHKLIVAIGLIGLAISLIGLGWAPDLMETSGILSRTLLVLFICTLNIAVQPVQLGLRVLIIENCRPQQQNTASAWAARMTGIGNILAQLVGSVDTTKLQPFMTANHFKNLCLLTSICLALTTIILGVFVTNKGAFKEAPEKQNQESMLKGVWEVMHTLSPEVLNIWKVQVFSWMGWFPFLYYVTSYVDYLEWQHFMIFYDIKQ
ncbi:hypothetical protein UA08_09217 [Talaromyces atroroseus]|uniref:Major facilitator superfamily (MFS) profile domain-containing protein n=1 Tax=Talaromyces atroroseus TaxID=1441469 RepID=A0A1Q5Q702_TALAT|nr:hypothetical protein UA08_09217 [Talaromyces atroroseus]OKL55530.1 hypothetical protein UA08_09217 [Talaromyces atroroseus]